LRVSRSDGREPASTCPVPSAQTMPSQKHVAHTIVRAVKRGRRLTWLGGVAAAASSGSVANVCG